MAAKLTMLGGQHSCEAYAIAGASGWLAADLALGKAQEFGDEDPLDAFMAAEVAPEVKAKEAAEEAKKGAERQRLAAELAVRRLFPYPLPLESCNPSRESCPSLICMRADWLGLLLRVSHAKLDSDNHIH